MLSIKYLLLLQLLTVIALITFAEGDDKEKKEQKEHLDIAWSSLAENGYVSTSGLNSKHEGAFTQAVVRKKAFAGSSSSSDIVDNSTIATIGNARCGHPDVVDPASGRSKRYAFLKTKWETTSLTYSIINSPAKSLSSSAVSDIIREAIRMWTDVTCMSITESSGSSADINIGFYSYSHGDGYAFDGPGNLPAHSFDPPDGKLHFDNSETWTDATSSGTNLLQIAVHHFGHILGLDHTSVRSAVMYSTFGTYRPNFQLEPDDINGIQALYGGPPCAITAGTTSETTTKEPTTTPEPTTTQMTATTQETTPTPETTTEEVITTKATTTKKTTTRVKTTKGTTTRPLTSTKKMSTTAVRTTTKKPTTTKAPTTTPFKTTKATTTRRMTTTKKIPTTPVRTTTKKPTTTKRPTTTPIKTSKATTTRRITSTTKIPTTSCHFVCG